jgi:hypothetical protein
VSTATQSIQFPNISATTAAFAVKGGTYGLTVSATTFGSVQLQTLSLDGATWLNAGSAISANGFVSQALPPGQYRFLLAGASAVYAALTSVPS